MSEETITSNSLLILSVNQHKWGRELINTIKYLTL